MSDIPLAQPPAPWAPPRERAVPPYDASGTCELQYSEALGALICERLAGGESVRAICAQADMPSRATVHNWVRAVPAFAAAYHAACAEARAARRGRDADRQLAKALRLARRGNRPSAFSGELSEAICAGVARGRTVAQTCAALGFPRPATVYKWLRERPDFAEAYALAREMFADAQFARAWAVAEAATPDTVAADRLRFDVIRWQTARLAPKKYSERQIRPDEEPLIVVVRRFGDGED